MQYGEGRSGMRRRSFARAITDALEEQRTEDLWRLARDVVEPLPRHLRTDFVDPVSGLEKRWLVRDEVEALVELLRRFSGWCLEESHGTRAPRFCGLESGHPSGHLFYSPLQMLELVSPGRISE